MIETLFYLSLIGISIPLLIPFGLRKIIVYLSTKDLTNYN